MPQIELSLLHTETESEFQLRTKLYNKRWF